MANLKDAPAGAARPTDEGVFVKKDCVSAVLITGRVPARSGCRASGCPPELAASHGSSCARN
eukprot:6176348-Pleurochrysis_carterae.AAC.1